MIIPQCAPSRFNRIEAMTAVTAIPRRVKIPPMVKRARKSAEWFQTARLSYQLPSGVRL